ncbi:hypothetical protein PIB30_014359 [Stylosanthes scabra]|uniref:Uncharacterized protein n=1 Tax=Stylosanthes scabra TaxID=79078 RepID=A0ABU6S7A2_9FABA|nr:hypothetical protein [Stylosanthes scabra]
MSLSPKFMKSLSKQVMELHYSCNQGYTPWNPTPYQPHDLECNAYQSNGLGDAYYGYENPSPPYPPSQDGMDELFKALAQERNEIREVQRKIEIQLDLLIKLATLRSLGTLFPYTNQEGREDALLNEEDVESLHECLEEVEEGNEVQVAEDVDQKVEDNCKEPKGMKIVYSALSEVTPSKLPSEFQFEWVNLPTLNFIDPQHYALLETDDQLGALDGVLNKKEKESLELNASKIIACGKSELKAHSEHLYKLHNNRAKVGAFSLKKHLGPWQLQEKLVDSHRKGYRNHVWDPGKNYTSHHFWGVITCVGVFRDLLSPLVPTKSKHWALARPQPPGGAAARSENAIFLATGATAPPRPSYGAPARLARPLDGLARSRGELGHIRPKLPSCMARSPPPLGASARLAGPRDGLGASAPSS